MGDPPGSLRSPAVKAEPQEDPDGVLPLNTGEIIEISDDEDEVVPPATTRVLGSPFQEPPHGPETISLGRSMLATKSKTVQPNPKMAAIKDKIAAKRLETAERLRTAPKSVQRTPPVGRGVLFVTESNPGTPDPAETFRVLQREVDLKRQTGDLTWQEEIQFERAQAAEKARVNKERLDRAYDGSDDAASIEDDPRMSPSVASLPDEEDDPEPKKRGRKRKASDSASNKPQPKKRRAAPKSAEDILVTARRKQEAKAKAKKQAPKKQGRKPKPSAPGVLNTAGILGSNVFEDAARMRDMPSQPTFNAGEKTKDKALRSLIASVPEEYRPVAKTDKKFLEDGMIIISHPLHKY